MAGVLFVVGEINSLRKTRAEERTSGKMEKTVKRKFQPSLFITFEEETGMAFPR